jgi:hypothetical protein
VIPLWFTTVVVKLELVDTCSWYEVAPVEAFQLSVGVIETPVALFDGERRVGAGGLPPELVVKLQMLEYALVPLAFVALTRQ